MVVFLSAIILWWQRITHGVSVDIYILVNDTGPFGAGRFAAG